MKRLLLFLFLLTVSLLATYEGTLSALNISPRAIDSLFFNTVPLDSPVDSKLRILEERLERVHHKQQLLANHSEPWAVDEIPKLAKREREIKNEILQINNKVNIN